MAGIVVLGASLAGAAPRARRWALAATLMALVALGANLLLNLRDAAVGLDGQRVANSELPEHAARERCLHDAGHPTLPAALAGVRRLIPERARYRFVTGAAVRACVALNLMPRVPARPDSFDPARDWSIFHRAVPEEVREEAERQRALPEAERTHHVHGPEVVVVRPGAAAGA